ncbi:hypothetical protein [Paludibaculum fermentans]|uniref:hypothetical protein n=1 Tax=Paludibaculum fermentans TaxID=1473598 RepID=UPI003EB6A5C9
MSTFLSAPGHESGSPPETLRAPGLTGHEAAWRRWLRPSLFDVIVVVLPLWFFVLSGDVASSLLSDGDTGWHIRTGDWMLQHKQFVREDLFSFSKTGQPWFAWEWLTDVLYSVIHTAAGLKGIVLLTMALASLYVALLFRTMVRQGANIFIAFPLVMLGFGAASVHLLARPHIWTMVLLALAMWMIEADLEKPGRRIWLLLPLTAVWTNLHGGWLALVAILGLVAVAKAGESWLGRAEWKTVWRYAGLAGGCLAASLLNPYGWHLHVHTFEFLTEGWAKELISEYKSPMFRTENMAMFEVVLLLSVVAVSQMLRRRALVGPVLLLFWAHESLLSARHIPLFLTVALPLLAGELARLWQAWTGSAARKSMAGIVRGIAADAQPAISRASVWVLVPFLAAPLAPLHWPADLSAESFPIAMVAKHRELLAHNRVFASDQWADYLIYRGAAGQKTFLDGRSDFFGEKLARDYCNLLNAPYDWRQLVKKYGFTAFLVDRRSPLASVLGEAAEWRLADEDGKVLLFLPRN